jgi:hypothetical protein
MPAPGNTGMMLTSTVSTWRARSARNSVCRKPCFIAFASHSQRRKPKQRVQTDICGRVTRP